jgi:phage terminase large subunit-like protein
MRSRSRKPRPWWGDDGPAPHIVWPGVTIEIPAVWSASRLRWESPDARYYFDCAAADKAYGFFSTFLEHHIGEFAGRPFELLPYQAKTLTRPLFGWMRAADNLRRFRKVLLFAPKGAGKSPWGAGTGLFLTFFDDEPGADVFALARDREQARVVFGDAQAFIEHAPELAERCDVLKDSIHVPATRSTFRVLSADASGHHGWRPHGVLLDELQEQRARGSTRGGQKIDGEAAPAGADSDGACGGG